MTITKEMITIHEQEYDDTNFDFGDIQKVITPTLIQAIESKGLDVQQLLYLSHTLMFEKYQNTLGSQQDKKVIDAEIIRAAVDNQGLY